MGWNIICKRRKLITEKIEPLKTYPLEDAIDLLISLPKVKFNESIDISINLGVDPDKSDQNVRGSSSLPHGIGKISKVAVFAEGPDAAAAKKAGADIVGFEDLIDEVKKNKDIDVDIIIATPECMKLLGQLGRILGPKNLMPNPKEGTVTKNIADAVKNAKILTADYRGLTANQLNEFRKISRHPGIYIKVVKNNMLKMALKDSEFSVLSDKISGPRILAVSNDSPGEFAKLIKTFIDNNENIELKSLAYKGEELDISEIKKLASLPTYDEAIAMLMSVMQAPLQKLMATMNAVPTKIVRTLDAIKQSKD